MDPQALRGRAEDSEVSSEEPDSLWCSVPAQPGEAAGSSRGNRVVGRNRVVIPGIHRVARPRGNAISLQGAPSASVWAAPSTCKLAPTHAEGACRDDCFGLVRRVCA